MKAMGIVRRIDDPTLIALTLEEIYIISAIKLAKRVGWK